MSAEGAGGEVNVGVVGSEKEGGSVCKCIRAQVYKCKCGGLKCIRADNLFSPSAPPPPLGPYPYLTYTPLPPPPHTLPFPCAQGVSEGITAPAELDQPTYNAPLLHPGSSACATLKCTAVSFLQKVVVFNCTAPLLHPPSSSTKGVEGSWPHFALPYRELA